MSALKASNYPDIMTAINSMADGDSMEIDANVPFPCTDTGTAWAGFNYCCRPNARGIEIWGHDDASIIDMQNYNPSMAILLNGVIGADGQYLISSRQLLTKALGSHLAEACN